MNSEVFLGQKTYPTVLKSTVCLTVMWGVIKQYTFETPGWIKNPPNVTVFQ